VPYRGKLKIYDVRSIFSITNLEYEVAVRAIDPKIEVPLTTEIMELTFDAVSRLEKLSGLVLRYLGQIALKQPEPGYGH
jgi:hypothetical protein